MTARPIIFNAQMVRALVTGRKTQTRRVVKPFFPGGRIVNLRHEGESGDTCSGRFNDPMSWGLPYAEDGVADMPLGIWLNLCPYGKPGDLLWVRETWSGRFDQSAIRVRDRQPDMVWYWADGNSPFGDWERPRPSIHMPRWASRLTLRLTDVRVERVQDISDADAKSEGCHGRLEEPDGAPWCSVCRGSGWVACAPDGAETECGCVLGGRKEFRLLWDSINAGRGHGWDVNPWVWAISFDVLRQNVDDVIGGES